MGRTGYRRLGGGHYAGHDRAAAYAGLPDGFSHPGQLLEDAERCGPDLPFPAECLPLARVLLSYTAAADWCGGDDGRGGGRRPLVWPGNAALAGCLGRSVRSVQRQLDALEGAGAIWRDQDGLGRRIIDLSPLAALAPVIRRLAREADARRRRLAGLARAMTRAWSEVVMACSAVEDASGEAPHSLRMLRDRARALRAQGRGWRDEEMARGLTEQLAGLAAEAVRQAKDILAFSSPTSSLEDAGDTHTTTRPSPSSNPPIFSHTPVAREPARQEDVVPPAEGYLDTPPPADLAELRRLLFGALPRFRRILIEHLGHDPARAGRRELLDAAEVLRQELGMAREPWAAAIARHGWESVVAATVTVAAKPAEEIRIGPAAVLRGMLRKPPAELRPWPSLHRLRERRRKATDGVDPGCGDQGGRLPLDQPLQPALQASPGQLARAVAALAAMPPDQRGRWYQRAVTRLGEAVPGEWVRPARWAHAVVDELAREGLL